MTMRNPFAAGAVFAALGLAALAITAAPAPALAQSAVCEEGRKLFVERQNIMQRINSWQKNKVNPAVACRTLGQLQSNGTRTMKWLEVNKDWCQVPEEAVSALKNQQSQAESSRGTACKAAADYSKALAQAREQQKRAQQGGNAAFSGVDGFTDAPRPVPQGAL